MNAVATMAESAERRRVYGQRSETSSARGSATRGGRGNIRVLPLGYSPIASRAARIYSAKLVSLNPRVVACRN